MAWTVNGVVVSNERGWTADANRFVEKIKKWANGRENRGPTGYKLKPARVLARSLADRVRPTGHAAKKPTTKSD